MSNKTKLNKNLNIIDNSNNSTVLNNKIIHKNNKEQLIGNSTVLNPNLVNSRYIAKGTILCNKYRIREKISVATGEADLYVCEYKGELYVAKVYRRSISIKQEVLNKLKQIDSTYVAKLYDSTKYNEFSVEIISYYSRGSLQGKTFTYNQLREHIIPCLNEGLKVLHNVGIIHKDLKPSNIMVTDDDLNVSIIDFGISSIHKKENTIILTETGMTPEYSAPETYKGLFHEMSDYYSMGITLYELFCGKTPYNNITGEERERYIYIQKIPFPKNMPVELQELIKGLTYNDISNRNDKNNPNRRWGYDEVNKWLKGIKQTIPGEGIGNKNLKPYIFEGKEYTNKNELIYALIENWNEGKKHLFRGLLSNYFKVYDSEAFKICQSAENEATKISGKDDLIFWKTMYKLQPNMKDFFWKGKIYNSLSAMGRELLECLRENDSSVNDFMDSIYKDNIMSKYLLLKEIKNKKTLEAINSLEKLYNSHKNDEHNIMVDLYLTAYMLSGQHILYIDGKEFHNIDELNLYMKNLLSEDNGDIQKFKDFCYILMNKYEYLNPAFESWLIAIGKSKELKVWKENMKH